MKLRLVLTLAAALLLAEDAHAQISVAPPATAGRTSARSG